MEWKAQTKVITYRNDFRPIVIETIDSVISKAVSEGTTDGQKTTIQLSNGLWEHTRNWTTVEAAKAFVEFLTTEGKPFSCEIVEL